MKSKLCDLAPQITGNSILNFKNVGGYPLNEEHLLISPMPFVPIVLSIYDITVFPILTSFKGYGI